MNQELNQVEQEATAGLNLARAILDRFPNNAILLPRDLLMEYNPPFYQWFLFPGGRGKGHLHSDSGARILREACQRVGIEGASTHSFRRTALTMMSDAGIPLRIVQEVSGHRTLDELQKYLEVRPEQVRGAIAALSMLSHVGKPQFDDVNPNQNPRPADDARVMPRWRVMGDLCNPEQ